MEPSSEEHGSMVAISSPKTRNSHQYGNQQADYRPSKIAKHDQSVNYTSSLYNNKSDMSNYNDHVFGSFVI